MRDNILIVGGLHGMTRDVIEGKFDDIIDFAEVGDFVDTPFRHLSSGMKTRVAFSLVTSLNEPTVIIDETLSVGDRGFKQKAYERVDQMLSGGEDALLGLAQRAAAATALYPGIYLRRGRVVLDADIDDVLTRYAEDRAFEGHPGWKGERKKAKQQRRTRRRAARKLAREGEAPIIDADPDLEEDDIPAANPGRRSGQ